MAPVKKTATDNHLFEYVFDEPLTEGPLWVEMNHPDDSGDIMPEIVDVLGCFCEQTGAQFG